MAREKRIEKKLPCKITLSVITGYDKDYKPIKERLLDVYAKPIEVWNANKTHFLYTEYKELITRRIIARSIPDHKYLEFPNFQRYGTYTGDLDKTYQTLKIGDIDIEFDKGYGLSDLLEHELRPDNDLDRMLVCSLTGYYGEMYQDIERYMNEHSERTLNDYFDTLDYVALQKAFPFAKIDQNKPLKYYNKEEYVFVDDDDLLLLRYHELGGLFSLAQGYYYEVVTGRKFAVQYATDNHMDKDQTFHFDCDFNRDVLASRILSEEKIKDYKREKPKVISKRIDDILARQYAKDQKRIAERKAM